VTSTRQAHGPSAAVGRLWRRVTKLSKRLGRTPRSCHQCQASSANAPRVWPLARQSSTVRVAAIFSGPHRGRSASCPLIRRSVACAGPIPRRGICAYSAFGCLDINEDAELPTEGR
jgi:hypothetical protein